MPQQALRRRCRQALAGVGAALPWLAAHAQWAPSVALDSDYRLRGVSLSDAQPTLHATLDYDGASGGYAGLSASRVAIAPRERYTRLLGYAGWVLPLGTAHRIEFGASRSHFAGDPGQDYTEAYAGVLAERWSTRLYVAPDYFGWRTRTVYAEWNAHRPMGPDWRLFGHLGLLVPLRPTAGAAGRVRVDLRLGAGLAWQDVDLQWAWVAVSGGGPYPAARDHQRQAWVWSASYAF